MSSHNPQKKKAYGLVSNGEGKIDFKKQQILDPSMMSHKGRKALLSEYRRMKRRADKKKRKIA